MEDALQVDFNKDVRVSEVEVLILVLMEDALQEVELFGKHVES